MVTDAKKKFHIVLLARAELVPCWSAQWRQVWPDSAHVDVDFNAHNFMQQLAWPIGALLTHTNRCDWLVWLVSLVGSGTG